MTKRRRSFGNIERRRNGYRASYVGPDGIRYRAPHQYAAKLDAEAWLADRKRDIDNRTWEPPDIVEARRQAEAQARVPFGDYAEAWLQNRNLAARTRGHYRKLLDQRLLPTFDRQPIADIEPGHIAAWHYQQGDSAPTARAHAYALMRTILNAAVAQRLIDYNPAQLPGAGNAQRARTIEPASLEELETIVQHMSDYLQLPILLLAWGAFRFGELVELRRRDIDLNAGVVHVRRAVSWVNGQPVVTQPKTAAGVRDVHLPRHLLPLLKEHMRGDITGGRDGLVFPSVGDPHKPLRASTVYNAFGPAREAAGRPDLRLHDLRHTGAVMAAQSGATMAELMARLGHTTAAAAMRYQHASHARDRAIADKLADMVEGVIR